MKTALYRKYRPQRFDDVVGQNAVVAALKNQVKSGRIGHSYIFTGIRGTGKTSFAKILAKAVNCLDSCDGEPCGVCEICAGIDNASMLDVTEIDAASNSGVDNVRALRDETAYYPAVCRMRVYIIDEVHMLTREAFNALLKIMEEPPSHVLFILATTEIHKVPATILSRCQRFDLKRISTDDIKKQLLYIAKQENLELTEDGAAMIARLADGAMRDALSLLDTCSSLGGTVDEATVSQLAGVADKSYLFELAEGIARKDMAALFEKLSELYAQSIDPTRLCLELVRHYRNLLMFSVSSSIELNDCSDDDSRKYKEQAARSELKVILYTMTVLSDTADKMAGAPDRILALELCFIKLCAGAKIAAPDIQDEVPWNVPTSAETKKSASHVLADPPRHEPKPFVANVSAPTVPKTAMAENLFSGVDGERPFTQWRDVVERLRGSSGMLYGFLTNSRAYLSETHVLIDAGEFFLKHIRENAQSKDMIKNAIAEVTGIQLPIGPYTSSSTADAFTADEPDELDDIDDLISRARRGGVDLEIK